LAWGVGTISTAAEQLTDLDDGYPVAFNRLAGRFRARGLTSDDAADLAQEAVTLTLSHLRRHGRQRADLGPLMNTIARNLLVERFRSGGRELAMEIHEQHLPFGEDVGDSVTRRARAERVRHEIAALPERQRDAVIMWLDGAGPADIAQRLDLKRNAADALLHRAKRRLAEKLGDCREAVWGSGAIMWLRPRVRRIAWWLGSMDAPIGNVAPLLVAITAAAVLTAAAPQPQQTATDARVVRSQDAPITSDRRPAGEVPGSAGATALAERNAPPRDAADDPVTVDVREHEISVRKDVTNPATGEPTPLGVGFRHEREENRGLVGEHLDTGTETICEGAPSACWEG
jgi:DNA-directed RNA polymerase specialized sigma24 family protein